MKQVPETYERIWATVARIPRGRVATYGTVAHVAGFGSHARLVGYALHALPEGTGIPWHRVINARGEISLRRAGGGSARQRKLLEREGLTLRKGKIDLSRYGWPR